MRISTIKLIVAILLVLLLAALVVAVAREAIVASNVSNTASFHELQGIQGADTTQNVAQQKKAKAAGKPEVAKELEEIRRQKVIHYQTITGAQRFQNQYYDANERGNDASEFRAELERRIPEARSALTEVKTLTEREVVFIKNDKQALYISESFYNAMETIVNTLQLEDLTPEQIESREKNVQRAGISAIANAHVMARGFDSDTMEADEKLTLEQEVVEPGEKAVKGLGDVLGLMPQIIWASLQGATEGLTLINQAMNSYQGSGGMEQMMHDLTYNQGMFSRKNMDDHQRRMDAIGSGVHQFLGTYSPFVKTVGNSIGRQTNVDAMGYGENVIIRFADSNGRMYILEEDEHMRIMVDKVLTKWDEHESEVRTMVIFEYDDAGVDSVVAVFDEFAPGFEQYIRDSRIIYVYRGYRPTVWKSFLFEINFQDSEGREQYHYEFEGLGLPEGETIRRESLDRMILETIGVMNPPKNDAVFRSRFGPKPQPKSQNQEQSGERRKDDKPEAAAPSAEDKPVADKTTPDKPAREPKRETKPSKPAVSKNGAIDLPTEGTEVFDSLNIDEATKAAMLQEHESGVENFNAGQYGLALRQFGRAAGMSEENYLDAYWAALAAHNAKNPNSVKRWLDYCLTAKSDYIPALNMKKALKLK